MPSACSTCEMEANLFNPLGFEPLRLIPYCHFACLLHDAEPAHGVIYFMGTGSALTGLDRLPGAGCIVMTLFLLGQEGASVGDENWAFGLDDALRTDVSKPCDGVCPDCFAAYSHPSFFGDAPSCSHIKLTSPALPLPPMFASSQ